MQLMRALRARPGEVVAFTGGGGKTGAMFRLAAEIVAAGGRVVTTTTTRIFAAQTGLAPRHVAAVGGPRDDPGALKTLAAALDETGHALLTAFIEPGQDKAVGVTPEWITALRSLPGRPTVLVEADGSRMRPFKAPADHEPIIPPETDLVVPVVGADVFGAALTADRVHRPERVAALAGVELGSEVTPEVVAHVLGHPAGGLKGVPATARVVVLINKVETDADRAAARRTAKMLLAHDIVWGVALAAVQRDPPALETWGRVAAVVLAAGRSSRMGQAKQLLPWGETTVVGETVRRLQTCAVAQVLVVTGAERAAVEGAVARAARPDGAPVTFAHNPDFASSEMARSLQVALHGMPANCLAVVVALADQPGVEPANVERIIAAWRETQAPVAAPYFRGRRGHPLLFDRAAWPHLLRLPANANPREALEALPPPVKVEARDDSILQDMDTPEAYTRAVSRGIV